LQGILIGCRKIIDLGESSGIIVMIDCFLVFGIDLPYLVAERIIKKPGGAR
jgi:hypothetical protein